MAKVQKNEFRFRAMGTEFLFRIYSETDEVETARCETVAHQAIARVRLLEDQLSEFKATSSVGEINLSFPRTPVSVGSDFAKVFTQALQVRLRTEGAFDPFIKSGIRMKEEDFSWNPETLVFLKNNSALKLSFGAIGKGFALDEVAAILMTENFTSFVISAGGSSIIRSRVEDIPEEAKIFWVLDKNHSEGDSGYSGTWLQTEPEVLKRAISYSVSAEYERGKHILGGASYAPLQATLVADRSACISDALATAFFVAGWEGVSQWGGQAAFLSVDHQQIPSWNTEAGKLFIIPDDWMNPV
ncbi:MAG: FAD:protein FMN transferase [Bdellovibrionales bacterium]|nr:FAD:protein FMN transferase [Oligoflexia bacterium]